MVEAQKHKNKGVRLQFKKNSEIILINVGDADDEIDPVSVILTDDADHAIVIAFEIVTLNLTLRNNHRHSAISLTSSPSLVVAICPHGLLRPIGFN